MKPFLDRKDLVTMMPDLSVRQIRSNEKVWGLDKCRCDRNARCVRYDTRMTIIALTKAGQKFVVPSNIATANELKYFYNPVIA